MNSDGGIHMDYKAKKTYQEKEVVFHYDEKRFKGLKGAIVNKLEMRLIRRALNFAKIKSPDSILDIPCGTGRLSIYLAQKGFSVIAVDLSAEMVAYLNNRVKNMNLGDRIFSEVGDAESLPYSDNRFNCCVSLRLFGHTPPAVRKKILSELRRVTKIHCVVAYYHKNCLQNLLRQYQRRKRDVEWHPVTYEEIEKEMKEAGLSIIKYFPFLFGISETIVVLAKK